MNDREFERRTVLVTGGGSGLGKAAALAFGRRGGRVAILSRSEDRLESAAREIGKTGADVLAVAADVRSPEALEAAVDRIEKNLGPLEILVNNAAGNFLVPSEQLTPNGFRAVVEIVLHGTWFCSSIVGRRMLSRGRGVMV
ncbi:MAG: SDR family NAD(P)-dependent oxidoreductase, partial [Thermoanaerobaculia bacterium]